MRFLQKINIYIYVIFLLLIIFFTPKTFAYYNNNTSFNVDIPNYEERLKSRACNGVTFYDYIDYIIDNIDFDTSVYDLLITDINDVSNPGSFVYFYLHAKSSNTGVYDNDYTMWVRGDSSKKYSYSPRLWTMKTGYLSFGYVGSICSSNIDPYTDPFTLSLINYIQYGTLVNNVSQTEVGYIGVNSSTNLSISETLSTMNNNTSYNVTKWWYYSSHKYVYYNQDYTNSSYYYKKVCLVNEDKCYLPGDTYDSYYDLHHVDEPDNPTYIGYQDSLQTFYTSLSPTDKNNYQLKVKFRTPQSILGFYQTPQEYIDNISFDFVCGGRVNNTNYYTYDTFNCSLSYSYSITDNLIEYTFNNLNISNTITNYDKIYVTIKSNYLDSNISTTLFDYSYVYSLGSFFNTEYKGSIYENFANLPLNFKLYMSSNNSLVNSNVYVRKYNFIDYNIKYIGFSNVNNQQNLVIGSSILGNANVNQNIVSSDFIQTNVTNSIDTGIMIYQDNGSIILPSLDLFFNGGLVLSFNNTSSNDFYYVDNEGTIQNNTFTKPIIADTNDYDISFYITQVNDFIDSLSADSLEFATLTQNFYNNLPLFFQTFIFIIFILFCIYFTYLLIKRR